MVVPTIMLISKPHRRHPQVSSSIVPQYRHKTLNLCSLSYIIQCLLPLLFNQITYRYPHPCLVSGRTWAP